MEIDISPRSDSGEPESDWEPRRDKDGYKERA
jgi:hypothetical protein